MKKRLKKKLKKRGGYRTYKKYKCANAINNLLNDADFKTMVKDVSAVFENMLPRLLIADIPDMLETYRKERDLNNVSNDDILDVFNIRNHVSSLYKDNNEIRYLDDPCPLW